GKCVGRRRGGENQGSGHGRLWRFVRFNRELSLNSERVKGEWVSACRTSVSTAPGLKVASAGKPLRNTPGHGTAVFARRQRVVMRPVVEGFAPALVTPMRTTAGRVSCGKNMGEGVIVQGGG